jgi:dGTPase
MSVRELIEKLEEIELSPYATKSIYAIRKEEEPPCPLRTAFQRDRDRIIHSKAFRRLKHKTQVFFPTESDHFSTRMTHTLEVAQIGRTIARALRLNEDLVEAIALGHDLGHTPFGHIGEEVLDAIYREKLGEPFHHAQQSVRVIEFLESRFTPEGEKRGLNLTIQVIEGIENHSKGSQNLESLLGYPSKTSTFEAHVVLISDRLAYLNHDVDDAIRAKIISEEEIPDKIVKVLGRNRSERVNTMVTSLVSASLDKPFFDMDLKVVRALDDLKDFLYEKVYKNPDVRRWETGAKVVIQKLCKFYESNPDRIGLDIYSKEETVRRIGDYLAGMTDIFALRSYYEIYGDGTPFPNVLYLLEKIKG